MKSVLAALVAGFTSFSAFATVDAFNSYYVMREAKHEEGLCYFKTHMWAEYGMPMTPVASVLTSPVVLNRYYIGSGGHNVASEDVSANSSAETVVTIVNEDHTETTQMLDLKIDVTNVTKSPAEVVRQGKAHLLALVKTFQEQYPGTFALKVEFVGLPSQDGLPGAKLNAKTQYPYNASSPLIKTYEKELLAQYREFCNE